MNILKKIYLNVFGDCRWRLPKIDDKLDTDHAINDYVNDIHNVPPASGPMRLIQLSSLSLLKEITNLLDAGGIEYSLCGGTLLGAIRHHGFIPWDDDIDMAVRIEDYETVLRCLKEHFAERSNFRISRSNCVRVIMNGAPCQVDIFPFETHYIEKDTHEARMSFSARRDDVMRKIAIDWNRLYTDGKVILNPEVIPSVIDDLKSFDSGNYKILLTGCEARNFGYPPLKYDWVFPLKKARFEGMDFSVPNNPHIVLFNYFGDYMRYPKLLHEHDDIQKRMTVDAYEKMLAYISDQKDSTGISCENIAEFY